MIAIIRNKRNNLKKVLEVSEYTTNKKIQLYDFYKKHKNYDIEFVLPY